LPASADESFAAHADWGTMSDTEHFVQFYESSEFLVGSVAGFIGNALDGGNSGIVIATPEHRRELTRQLSAGGIDLAAGERDGRLVILDAATALSQFMVSGTPDPQRFERVVGSVIANMAGHGRRIHAFGEMVALLWADGNRTAAIALEQLWNDLAKRYRFSLFCAYPISDFADSEQQAALTGVCACHSRVIPAESYSNAVGEDQQMRAIALLQQKAQSLETEIQHRQEVQKALVKRERELADFFENATEGLHKVGPTGIVLWANKAEYELLGYEHDEFVGHSITEFHADPAIVAGILERLKRGESLINFPVRLQCKSGAIKHVLVSSNACFENGEFVYTRCFTRDITQQWEAEKSLREADRRKDEFLATLSHELRNPLAPIRNALELLDRESADESSRMEAPNIIRRQVDQLARLVDDLIDISRVTRDKIELRKENIELAAVMRSAVETSRPAIDGASHQLSVQLPERPLYLQADPARLAQVFSNLLNNAAKFTPEGGKIDFDAREDGREVVVSVRDDGVGIACDELAFVFDIFRQGDKSLERSRGGLGIGLTLVRRFVELHGGTVNAQSEGEGKGAEFTVRLPLVDVTQRTPKAMQPNDKQAVHKRRILVVDDNRDAGDTLAMLLKLKGHEVSIARDGLQAVDMASEFRPDVILMDIGMPKLNGYDATRRIRETEHGRGTFIVALTGWGQTADIARSAEAGCSAHLVKPVDFVALDRLLANPTIAN